MAQSKYSKTPCPICGRDLNRDYCGYPNCSKEKAEARSRLISAAPDLLQLALHIQAMSDDAYLAGHPEWQVIVKEAQAAIAKAEGK